MSPWALPAAAGTGAVLGWLASLVLPRLLFRPRMGASLLGRPLGPSVFHRTREALALYLGEDFTSGPDSAASLSERLGDPALRSDMRRELEARIGAALDSPAGELVSGGLPGALFPSEIGLRAWASFVESEGFSRAMAEALGKALELVGSLPLSALLSPEAAGELASSFLSEDNRGRIEEALLVWARGGGAGLPVALSPDGPPPPAGRRLVAGLIPAEALEPLVRLFAEALYDAAVPVAERFLDDGETRATIERSANEIVRRAIGRLNVLQRLIVGAANYEGSLAESMPETIEDLVSMVSSILRSRATRSKAVEAALEAWRQGFSGGSGGLGDFLADWMSREAVARALASTLGLLAAEGEGLVRRARELARERADATLGGLLSTLGISLAPGPVRVELGPVLAGRGEAGEALAAGIEAFVSTFLASLAPVKLGDLVALDGPTVGGLAGWIAETSLDLVEREAGLIMRGLDLGSALAGRIRSIDAAEAEKALLGAPGLAPVLGLVFALAGGLAALLGALIASLA